MHSKKGFTFVEVVMTVFFLGVCILPLMVYIQNTGKEYSQTADRSLAMTVASQAMERFRKLSYDDLTTLCGANGLSEPELANDKLLKYDALPPSLVSRLVTDSYARTIAFKDTPDARLNFPAPAWAKVGLLTVTVKWSPPKLPASSLTLSKIVVGNQQ